MNRPRNDTCAHEFYSLTLICKCDQMCILCLNYELYHSIWYIVWLWLTMKHYSYWTIFKYAASQVGSPRSPDIEGGCNSGPGATKNGRKSSRYRIHPDALWGNGPDKHVLDNSESKPSSCESDIRGFLGKFGDAIPQNLQTCVFNTMLVVQRTQSRIFFIINIINIASEGMCQNHETSKGLSGQNSQLVASYHE